MAYVVPDSKTIYMIISIPGHPVAKQANKITGKGKHVRQYSSQTKEEKRYEQLIMLQCRSASHKPFIGAIRVDYEFIAERPKCHFGTGKNSHILKKNTPIHWIVKKNDFDNMLKFVNDRCSNKKPTKNKKGTIITPEIEMIWVDDCQIVCWSGEKRYCHHNEEPKTVLKISEV